MSSWDSRRRSSQPGSSSRLRMDSYSTGSRASRARAVSPKRRELDNVMKKARRDGPTQSNYWTKKLLEAEEKDPNSAAVLARWRHSGFKELYGGGTSSPVGSRSSYRRSRSRSRSRLPRRSRSRIRSPVTVSRPRSRERARDRDRERRPHTPLPQTQKVQSPIRGGRPLNRRSSRVASLSGSSRSLSSCSDESCSVCSPKTNKKVVPAPKYHSRSRSFSVPRNRPSNRSPVSPRAEPRRVREKSSPPRDPRRQPTSPPLAARSKVNVKQEEVRDKSTSLKKRKGRSKSGRRKRRRPMLAPEGSVLRRASPLPSASEDSSTSSVTSGGGATRLTLSERFGKMAQWSVDRRDFDGVKNMRITKEADSSDLKVVIEGDRYRSLSPAPVSDRRVGLGYYPEVLHSGPVGLDAWDDVRVRYKYYKDRGYLRDLTLDDYIKWEEWWYKYQDWLEAERYYERWAALRVEEAAATRSSRRRRMRR